MQTSGSVQGKISAGNIEYHISISGSAPLTFSTKPMHMAHAPMRTSKRKRPNSVSLDCMVPTWVDVRLMLIEPVVLSETPEAKA